MTQAIEKAAGGVWRTPGAAVQERAGATFLFCDPMVAQNSGKRKTQFSEHAPSDTRDLDTLLATVRGAYFDARRAGDLAQAAELAATYRHLYSRKLRAPAPATIPAAMPDKRAWAAWRANKRGRR